MLAVDGIDERRYLYSIQYHYHYRGKRDEGEGEEPVSRHHYNTRVLIDSARVWRISRRKRDGTAEPVSQD